MYRNTSPAPALELFCNSLGQQSEPTQSTACDNKCWSTSCLQIGENHSQREKQREDVGSMRNISIYVLSKYRIISQSPCHSYKRHYKWLLFSENINTDRHHHLLFIFKYFHLFKYLKNQLLEEKNFKTSSSPAIWLFLMTRQIDCEVWMGYNKTKVILTELVFLLSTSIVNLPSMWEPACLVKLGLRNFYSRRQRKSGGSCWLE